MATLNRTSSLYIPQDIDTYVVPVQQGDVYNLSIAVTPNRQGILGWYDRTANEMRCAVVPVLEDCFTNDVVPAGDVRTIWSDASRDIYTGVIFIYEANLYAFVSHFIGNPNPNGKVEVYIADDVENPVTWTLHGTLDNTSGAAGGGTTSFENRRMGVPTVSDTGRWLIPANTWRVFAGSALTDGLGVYTSDDDGATWTTRVDFRNAPILGGQSGAGNVAIGEEPSTGELGFHASPASGNNFQFRYSTDDGTSWSLTTSTAAPLVLMDFFIDDGTTLYGTADTGTERELFTIGDLNDRSTWTDLNLTAITVDTITAADGFQSIPLYYPSVLYGVAFTAKDRIAVAIACTNVNPPPLHIPFKDSYTNLQLNDDGTLDPFSVAQVSSMEFDNLKTLERWALEFMRATDSVPSCTLFIPWKQYLARADTDPQQAAEQSWDNLKTVERWGYRILAGECGCKCVGSTPPPARCLLNIPWKRATVDLTAASTPRTKPLTPDTLALCASRMFDNYKVIERWANYYARGECGCSN